jgi:hypothetical protein
VVRLTPKLADTEPALSKRSMGAEGTDQGATMAQPKAPTGPPPLPPFNVKDTETFILPLGDYVPKAGPPLPKK